MVLFCCPAASHCLEFMSFSLRETSVAFCPVGYRLWMEAPQSGTEVERFKVTQEGGGFSFIEEIETVDDLHEQRCSRWYQMEIADDI